MKKNSFSTKDLILSAIKNKLEGENIGKLLLNFSLHSDEYTFHVKPLDSEKAILFEVDKSDTSMIKRIFVSKIKRKIINIENYKTIMVLFDLSKDEIEMYLTDNKDEVTKLKI